MQYISARKGKSIILLGPAESIFVEGFTIREIEDMVLVDNMLEELEIQIQQFKERLRIFTVYTPRNIQDLDEVVVNIHNLMEDIEQRVRKHERLCYLAELMVNGYTCHLAEVKEEYNEDGGSNKLVESASDKA
jgi:hypothetical protein